MRSVGNKEKIKKLEQEIKETRNDLEDLMVYIKDLNFFLPIAVGNISAVGKIIDVNQAFKELTNYQFSEIIGKPLRDVFLEKEEIDKIFDEIKKKKIIRDKELTLVSKDGKKILVNLSASLREDKKGNIFGYFIAITDITEFKKLQEELEEKVQERTKELQERIEELEKFHRLTIGREMTMVELKKEIERLKEELEKSKPR